MYKMGSRNYRPGLSSSPSKLPLTIVLFAITIHLFAQIAVTVAGGGDTIFLDNDPKDPDDNHNVVIKKKPGTERPPQVAPKIKCKEYPLPERNKMADVIVSGTVQQLMDDEAHSSNGHRMLKGKIQIHRIFKGEQVIKKIATVTPGLFRPLQTVMVEGFGDDHICDNMVKERQNKIFMLVPNGNKDLKLNSSILPLTINALDHVDAVVKGKINFNFIWHHSFILMKCTCE